MFFKRKVIVLCSLLMCVCIIAAVTANKATPIPASAKLSSRPQIILDAGHEAFS